MDRTHLAFSILALIVVFSLVVGALGTAIVDGLSGGGDDQTLTVDPENQEITDAYEQELRRAATDDANDAGAQAALANYLSETGHIDEAIPFYERALEIEPENWDTRLVFAQALAEGDKRADAELQFKKVIAGQPDNAQAHYFLAELYRNWLPPRLDEAAAEYQRTVETGGTDYVAQQAAQALRDLGYASPAAATPAA